MDGGADHALARQADIALECGVAAHVDALAVLEEDRRGQIVDAGLEIVAVVGDGPYPLEMTARPRQREAQARRLTQARHVVAADLEPTLVVFIAGRRGGQGDEIAVRPQSAPGGGDIVARREGGRRGESDARRRGGGGSLIERRQGAAFLNDEARQLARQIDFRADPTQRPRPFGRLFAATALGNVAHRAPRMRNAALRYAPDVTIPPPYSFKCRGKRQAAVHPPLRRLPGWVAASRMRLCPPMTSAEAPTTSGSGPTTTR